MSLINVGLASPSCIVQLHRTSRVIFAVRSAKRRCGCRVAAMGGTPALGAGMVLPKLSQHQLHSLSSTESPAARELHAAHGRSDEAASTSPPPSVNTPNNSPPWLVRTLVPFCAVTGQCSKIDVVCVLSIVSGLYLCKEPACCATKRGNFAGRASKTARQLTTILPSQAVAFLYTRRLSARSQNEHVAPASPHFCFQAKHYSFPNNRLAF